VSPTPRELPGGLRAEAFAGAAGLVGLEAVWEELRQAAGADPLCNRWDWARAYVSAWVPDAAVFGWVLSAGDRAVALLPLRDEPRRGALALPRARLLCDGSYESDYLDLLVRPGYERPAVAAALELLRRRTGPQALVLGPSPAESAVLRAWREELAARRLPRRETVVECAVAPLPADFESYLGGLKPRMRSKVRQALRRAEERGARFAWADDPLRLDGQLEELFDLHTRRWRAAGGEGSFGDVRRRNFYRALFPDYLRRGLLRLARLEQDGRTVAVQAGFVTEGRYYQLQEGYDPELEEQRPATALRARMTAALIEEGVHTYDFMAGSSQHKADWGGLPRTCITLACALPKWRGRLAYAARDWRDRWRAARAD
jgi:CelD/BcsL family acetyltransferase involved in cellulose biosynthesis